MAVVDLQFGRDQVRGVNVSSETHSRTCLFSDFNLYKVRYNHHTNFLFNQVLSSEGQGLGSLVDGACADRLHVNAMMLAEGACNCARYPSRT